MPKEPGLAPRAEMPAWKWAVALIFAGLFDAIKFGCVCIVFLAPFIVGTIAGVIAKEHASTAGCWVAATAAAPLAIIAGTGVMQYACDTVSKYAAEHSTEVGVGVGVLAGVATAALEGAGAPITGAIEAVGVILAIIVGFVGWAFFMCFFLIARVHIFRDAGTTVLTILVGFLASEVPFLNALPSFTISIWRLTRTVRAHDKKVHKEWEKKKAAYQAAQRQRVAEQLRGMRAAEEAERAQEEALEQEEAERLLAEQEALNARKSPPLVPLPAY